MSGISSFGVYRPTYASRVFPHQIIVKLNAKCAVDDVRSPLARRQNESIKSFKISSRHTNLPFDRLLDKTKFEVSGVFLAHFLRAVV